jgi:hypothetical protein
VGVDAAVSIPDQIADGLKAHPARKGVGFNVAVTAVEVGGGIALFQLARHEGAGDVASYLIGSIGPVVGGLVIWIRAGKFSGASAAIFAFAAISALVALIGATTPKALLYKDCATTAIIGLLFLASCALARKPIAFYLAQRFGSDGTHDGMAIFDAMWTAYAEFRRGVYVISYMWAGLFLIQAAGTAWIIRRSNYSTAYNYDQILPLVATALGIAGSIVISRHYAHRGRSRGSAEADRIEAAL